MKKFVLASVILVSILCSVKVNAQYCGGSGSSVCSTAGSPLTAEGFYPDERNLPCVVDGQYYDTVVQIRTPSQVTQGGSSYTLSYITITSITNLPCGLCWQLGDPNNEIQGNADGCMRVKGTSYDAPGEYLMDIIVNATVSIGGFPYTVDGQNLSSQGLKFYARVQLPGGTCVAIDTLAAGNTASTAGNISIPSISGPTSVCTGGNATLTASGGAYYGYVWSTGAQTASINVTQSGTYTVTVYENCTTATASQTVTVSSGPTVTITPPATICAGTPTTLTASGGGTYHWSNGSTSAAITVSPTNNTNYSVTVTSGSNCSASSSTSLTVNAAPTVSISPLTDTVCAATATTLTATGTGTFSWSSGATTAAATVSPTSTTVYTVTITSTGNCSATASRTVVVNSSNATISATGPTTFCTGGSVGLKVDSSFATYSWSTGATTSTITVNTAGAYDATVTKNGCTGVSNSIVVSVGSNLSPTISANPTLNICPGGHTTLDAGSGYTTYLWSGGGGNHETAVVSTGGVYTVTVSQGTCSGSASATVVVGNFPLTVNITPAGPITTCASDTVILNAGSGFASYAWSSGSQIATAQVTSSGPYVVTVTKNACIGIDTVQVTVNPTPVPVISPAGPLVKCSNDTVILDAGSGFDAYLWSNGATTETIQPTANGTYGVTVTQTACPGAAVAPVSLTFNTAPAPVISPAGNVSVCSGTGGIQLDAGTGYSTYSWTNGATTETINVSTAGPYNVTVTQGNCSAAAVASNVSVVARPNAVIGTPVSGNGTAVLTASPVGASYQWLMQTSPNGSYTLTSNTSRTDTVGCGDVIQYYTVIATQNGCSDTSAAAEVVCVGINEIPSLVKFSVMPNPATDVLFVNYELNDNTNIKLSVIDLTGRKVMDVLNSTEVKGNHQHQIKLSDMSAGIYLLNFVTDNGSFNTKFVKQ